MNTYTVTITSKNQITLPAELVRNLKLSQGRRLMVEPKGQALQLTPEPSLREQMQPLWDKIARQRKGKPVLTDQELSAAARQVWASRDFR